MTRYFATADAWKKRPLSTGFDTEEDARVQAEYLANTYGWVAKVTTNEGDLIGKFSPAHGWH